ncbi:Intracellular septation protein A [Nitrosococcus halophilus Nc 4]|uniref:Inner membrane-spanning protein YciB n=1 Tax=Nitrosococcus halophilus (strain Nc4) TaxID=472759 RepID=D5BV52_NITHN|nr:septation protein A [Nitrosococcus halophilus]ADE15402.1 Intracellular septation protein A [Nitrosococcus halophilus Nc 4]
MKLFFDLFPVILFFCAYQFYDKLPSEIVEELNRIPFLKLTPGGSEDAILFATAVAILASALQVSLYFFKHHRFEPMHLVTLGLVTLLGGATLVFRDPTFIKWKPTVVNWLFGLAFLASQIFTRKPLVQRMMSTAITLPTSLWKRLNIAWVIFFLASGLANLYVAYQFTEAVWVNFKLFGMLGLTLLFVVGQAFYLTRYLNPSED